MQIEKKHKIYAGLVAAALLAWGIDATFFRPSEPSSASAVAAAMAGGTGVAAVEPPPPASSPTKSESSQENTGQWLGVQLRAWSEKNPDAIDHVHDMFSTPVAWVAQRPVAPPSAPGKIAEDFQREHHLTAVVLGANSGSAVIDGRLLRIGQSIGGCRLKTVSGGSAHLVGPDGREFRILIAPEEKKDVK